MQQLSTREDGHMGNSDQRGHRKTDARSFTEKKNRREGETKEKKKGS